MFLLQSQTKYSLIGNSYTNKANLHPCCPSACQFRVVFMLKKIEEDNRKANDQSQVGAAV